MLKTNFISPFANSERYTLDELGLGYLFADTYKNGLRYVKDAKAWYCFDGML